MTREQVAAIPRQSAAELLRAMFHNSHDVARIESALNIEWWRGYHAAKSETSTLDPK